MLETPSDGLLGAQIRSLTELCRELDRKCTSLLVELASERTSNERLRQDSQAATEALAAQNAHWTEQAQQWSLERAGWLSEREQWAAERAELIGRVTELSDERAVLLSETLEFRDRAHALSRRLAAAMMSEFGATDHPAQALDAAAALVNAEHAPPLHGVLGYALEALCVDGLIAVCGDHEQMLREHGVGGMLDEIVEEDGTAYCLGWIVSRQEGTDDPILVLVDDAGLIGLGLPTVERDDVREAFHFLTERPGFRIRLCRVPEGRLRGLTLITWADQGAYVYLALPYSQAWNGSDPAVPAVPEETAASCGSGTSAEPPSSGSGIEASDQDTGTKQPQSSGFGLAQASDPR